MGGRVGGWVSVSVSVWYGDLSPQSTGGWQRIDCHEHGLMYLRCTPDPLSLAPCPPARRVLSLSLSAENGLQDIRTADWSNEVAPFWGEVVKSAMTSEGILGLLKAGWTTIKGETRGGGGGGVVLMGQNTTVTTPWKSGPPSVTVYVGGPPVNPASVAPALLELFKLDSVALSSAPVVAC